jgi:hypothetical protein
VGKVAGGMSSTNFNNILLTLMVTERIPNVWGISRKFYSVNQALKQFFFIAELVSVVDQESDFVITKAAISKALNGKNQKQLSSGLAE